MLTNMKKLLKGELGGWEDESRSAGSAKVKLAKMRNDHVYHLYVFVVSLDGKTVSRSKYVGMYTTPASKKG